MSWQSYDQSEMSRDENDGRNYNSIQNESYEDQYPQEKSWDYPSGNTIDYQNESTGDYQSESRDFPLETSDGSFEEYKEHKYGHNPHNPRYQQKNRPFNSWSRGFFKPYRGRGGRPFNRGRGFFRGNSFRGRGRGRGKPNRLRHPSEEENRSPSISPRNRNSYHETSDPRSSNRHFSREKSPTSPRRSRSKDRSGRSRRSIETYEKSSRHRDSRSNRRYRSRSRCRSYSRSPDRDSRRNRNRERSRRSDSRERNRDIHYKNGSPRRTDKHRSLRRTSEQEKFNKKSVSPSNDFHKRRRNCEAEVSSENKTDFKTEEGEIIENESAHDRNNQCRNIITERLKEIRSGMKDTEHHPGSTKNKNDLRNKITKSFKNNRNHYEDSNENLDSSPEKSVFDNSYKNFKGKPPKNVMNLAKGISEVCKTHITAEGKRSFSDIKGEISDSVKKPKLKDNQISDSVKIPKLKDNQISDSVKIPKLKDDKSEHDGKIAQSSIDTVNHKAELLTNQIAQDSHMTPQTIQSNIHTQCDQTSAFDNLAHSNRDAMQSEQKRSDSHSLQCKPDKETMRKNAALELQTEHVPYFTNITRERKLVKKLNTRPPLLPTPKPGYNPPHFTHQNSSVNSFPHKTPLLHSPNSLPKQDNRSHFKYQEQPVALPEGLLDKQQVDSAIKWFMQHNSIGWNLSKGSAESEENQSINTSGSMSHDNSQYLGNLTETQSAEKFDQVHVDGHRLYTPSDAIYTAEKLVDESVAKDMPEKSHMNVETKRISHNESQAHNDKSKHENMVKVNSDQKKVSDSDRLKVITEKSEVKSSKNRHDRHHSGKLSKSASFGNIKHVEGADDKNKEQRKRHSSGKIGKSRQIVSNHGNQLENIANDKPLHGDTNNNIGHVTSKKPKEHSKPKEHKIEKDKQKTDNICQPTNTPSGGKKEQSTKSEIKTKNLSSSQKEQLNVEFGSSESEEHHKLHGKQKRSISIESSKLQSADIKNSQASPLRQNLFEKLTSTPVPHSRTKSCDQDLLLSPVTFVQTSKRESHDKGNHGNKIKCTVTSETISDCSVESLMVVDSWHEQDGNSPIKTVEKSCDGTSNVKLTEGNKHVMSDIETDAQEIDSKQNTSNSDDQVDIRIKVKKTKSIFDKFVRKNKSKQRTSSPLRLPTIKKLKSEKKKFKLLSKSVKGTKHKGETKHGSHKIKESLKESNSDKQKVTKEHVVENKDKSCDSESKVTLPIATPPKAKPPPVHALFGRKIRTGLEDFPLVKTPKKEKTSDKDISATVASEILDIKTPKKEKTSDKNLPATIAFGIIDIAKKVKDQIKTKKVVKRLDGDKKFKFGKSNKNENDKMEGNNVESVDDPSKKLPENEGKTKLKQSNEHRVKKVNEKAEKSENLKTKDKSKSQDKIDSKSHTHEKHTKTKTNDTKEMADNRVKNNYKRLKTDNDHSKEVKGHAGHQNLERKSSIEKESTNELKTSVQKVRTSTSDNNELKTKSVPKSSTTEHHDEKNASTVQKSRKKSAEHVEHKAVRKSSVDGKTHEHAEHKTDTNMKSGTKPTSEHHELNKTVQNSSTKPTSESKTEVKSGQHELKTNSVQKSRHKSTEDKGRSKDHELKSKLEQKASSKPKASEHNELKSNLVQKFSEKSELCEPKTDLKPHSSKHHKSKDQPVQKVSAKSNEDHKSKESSAKSISSEHHKSKDNSAQKTIAKSKSTEHSKSKDIKDSNSKSNSSKHHKSKDNTAQNATAKSKPIDIHLSKETSAKLKDSANSLTSEPKVDKLHTKLISDDLGKNIAEHQVISNDPIEQNISDKNTALSTDSRDENVGDSCLDDSFECVAIIENVDLSTMNTLSADEREKFENVKDVEISESNDDDNKLEESSSVDDNKFEESSVDEIDENELLNEMECFYPEISEEVEIQTSMEDLSTNVAEVDYQNVEQEVEISTSKETLIDEVVISENATENNESIIEKLPEVKNVTPTFVKPDNRTTINLESNIQNSNDKVQDHHINDKVKDHGEKVQDHETNNKVQDHGDKVQDHQDNDKGNDKVQENVVENDGDQDLIKRAHVEKTNEVDLNVKSKQIQDDHQVDKSRKLHTETERDTNTATKHGDNETSNKKVEQIVNNKVNSGDKNAKSCEVTKHKADDLIAKESGVSSNKDTTNNVLKSNLCDKKDAKSFKTAECNVMKVAVTENQTNMANKVILGHNDANSRKSTDKDVISKPSESKNLNRKHEKDAKKELSKPHKSEMSKTDKLLNITKKDNSVKSFLSSKPDTSSRESARANVLNNWKQSSKSTPLKISPSSSTTPAKRSMSLDTTPLKKPTSWDSTPNKSKSNTPDSAGKNKDNVLEDKQFLDSIKKKHKDTYRNSQTPEHCHKMNEQKSNKSVQKNKELSLQQTGLKQTENMDKNQHENTKSVEANDQQKRNESEISKQTQGELDSTNSQHCKGTNIGNSEQNVSMDNDKELCGLKIVSVCGNVDFDQSVNTGQDSDLMDLQSDIAISHEVDKNRPVTPCLENLDIILNSTPMKKYNKLKDNNSETVSGNERNDKSETCGHQEIDCSALNAIQTETTNENGQPKTHPIKFLKVIKMPSLTHKETRSESLTDTFIPVEANNSTDESEMDSSAEKLVIDTDTSFRSNSRISDSNSRGFEPTTPTKNMKLSDSSSSGYEPITPVKTGNKAGSDEIIPTKSDVDTSKRTVELLMELNTADSTSKNTEKHGSEKLTEKQNSTESKSQDIDREAISTEDNQVDIKQNDKPESSGAKAIEGTSTSLDETLIYGNSDLETSKDTIDYSENQNIVSKDNNELEEYDDIDDDEDIQITWYIKGIPQSPWTSATPHIKQEDQSDEEDEEFKQPPVLPELAEYFKEHPDIFSKMKSKNDTSGNSTGSSIVPSSQPDSPQLEDTYDNLFFTNMLENSEFKYEATPIVEDDDTQQTDNVEDDGSHQSEKVQDCNQVDIKPKNLVDNVNNEQETLNQNKEGKAQENRSSVDKEENTGVRGEKSPIGKLSGLKFDTCSKEFQDFKKKMKTVVSVKVNDKQELEYTTENVESESESSSINRTNEHVPSESESGTETAVSNTIRNEDNNELEKQKSIENENENGESETQNAAPSTSQTENITNTSERSESNNDTETPASSENMYDAVKNHSRQRKVSSDDAQGKKAKTPVMGNLLFPPAIQNHNVDLQNVEEPVKKLILSMKLFSIRLTNNGNYDFSKFNPVRFTHVKVLSDGRTHNTIGEFIPGFLSDQLLRCVKCLSCNSCLSPYRFLKHLCTSNLQTVRVSEKSFQNLPIPTERLQGNSVALWKLMFYVIMMEKHFSKNKKIQSIDELASERGQYMVESRLGDTSKQQQQQQNQQQQNQQQQHQQPYDKTTLRQIWKGALLQRDANQQNVSQSTPQNTDVQQNGGQVIETYMNYQNVRGGQSSNQYQQYNAFQQLQALARQTQQTGVRPVIQQGQTMQSRQTGVRLPVQQPGPSMQSHQTGGRPPFQQPGQSMQSHQTGVTPLVQQPGPSMQSYQTGHLAQASTIRPGSQRSGQQMYSSHQQGSQFPPSYSQSVTINQGRVINQNYQQTSQPNGSSYQNHSMGNSYNTQGTSYRPTFQPPLYGNPTIYQPTIQSTNQASNQGTSYQQPNQASNQGTSYKQPNQPTNQGTSYQQSNQASNQGDSYPSVGQQQNQTLSSQNYSYYAVPITSAYSQPYTAMQNMQLTGQQKLVNPDALNGSSQQTVSNNMPGTSSHEVPCHSAAKNSPCHGCGVAIPVNQNSTVTSHGNCTPQHRHQQTGNEMSGTTPTGDQNRRTPTGDQTSRTTPTGNQSRSQTPTGHQLTSQTPTGSQHKSQTPTGHSSPDISEATMSAEPTSRTNTPDNTNVVNLSSVTNTPSTSQINNTPGHSIDISFKNTPQSHHSVSGGTEIRRNSLPTESTTPNHVSDPQSSNVRRRLSVNEESRDGGTTPDQDEGVQALATTPSTLRVTEVPGCSLGNETQTRGVQALATPPSTSLATEVPGCSTGNEIQTRQLQFQRPQDCIRAFKFAQNIQVQAISKLHDFMIKDQEKHEKLQKDFKEEQARRVVAEKKLEELEKQFGNMLELLHRKV